jgi:membrane-associated protein
MSGQLPQLGFWTYILLVLLVAVEGHLGTLTGTAAASVGLMKPEWVFVAGMIGSLAGDSLWYALGYLGKMNWFLRLGRKMGLHADTLENLKNGLLIHTSRIMFLAVVTVSMVIPALFSAGLVKAPWRRWFPAVAAGEVLWNGSIVLIGFYATEAIKGVERALEYIAMGGGVVVFLIILILVGRHIFKERYQSNSDPNITKGK